MAGATHTCSCGRVCHGPAKPKTVTPVVDATKRYKGACPVCKAKLGHRDGCAMREAIRRMLLATTPEEMRAGVSPRFRAAMAVPSYSAELTVGCVTVGSKEVADAMRAAQEPYKLRLEAERAAHEAWTERWQSEAWDAYYASPEGLAELEAESHERRHRPRTDKYGYTREGAPREHYRDLDPDLAEEPEVARAA